MEYSHSKDSGRVEHELTIDDEVSDVPKSPRKSEGTTFVSESLYVAVHVPKSVL